MGRRKLDSLDLGKAIGEQCRRVGHGRPAAASACSRRANDAALATLPPRTQYTQWTCRCETAPLASTTSSEPDTTTASPISRNAYSVAVALERRPATSW